MRVAGARTFLPWLQAALAWTIVGSRFAAVALPDARGGLYAMVCLVLGFVVLPRLPLGRTGARWAPAWTAPLFAFLALGFHFAWLDLSAGVLPSWLADWGPWLLLVVVLLLDLSAVRRVLRLVGIEALKLARSRLVWLAALATTGVTLLAGFTHEMLPADTGWSLATTMLGAGFATAQVFVLVAGATAIAGEASQGTLKMILPQAYRRTDWVLAKALALALVALLLSALVVGAAWARVTAGPGFGDIVLTFEAFGGDPVTQVQTPADVMGGRLTDTVLAQALALVTVGALGLLVSCCVMNVVGALCASFLLFAALKLGDLVLGLDQEVLRRLFTWAPERLRELTAKFGQGFNEGWDERLPTVALLLALATSALCVLAGARAFARRDLHV